MTPDRPTCSTGTSTTAARSTLHALRRTIGDDAFFAVLRSWASERAAGNGSTDDFIALTNRISGTSVEPFVRSWLDADPMPRLPG